MTAVAEIGHEQTPQSELRPFILVHQAAGDEPVAVTVPAGYLETRAALMKPQPNPFSAESFSTDLTMLIEGHVSRVHAQAEDIVRGRELIRAQHGIGGFSLAELLSGQSGGGAAPGDSRGLEAGRRHDREVVATREQVLASEVAVATGSAPRSRGVIASSARLRSMPGRRTTATPGELHRLDSVDVSPEQPELRFAHTLANTTAEDHRAHSVTTEAADMPTRRERVIRAARRAGNYAVAAGLAGIAAYLVPKGVRNLAYSVTNEGTNYYEPVHGGPEVSAGNPGILRHPNNYQIDVKHTARSVLEASTSFGKGWVEVAAPFALIAGYAIARKIWRERRRSDSS